MKFSSSYLTKVADKLLGRHEQAQALKRIAQRKDWKITVKKCHDKISEEYKFWLMKADTAGRNARLKDLTKDVAFIKALELRESITSDELAKLRQVATKYDI